MLAWIFALLFALPAPDVFIVVHVKGSIVKKANNVPIKVGDKLTPDESLVFKSDDATASLVSPAKGRFTLRKSAGAKPGEFLTVLKDNLMAQNPALRLSSRAGALVNSEDLRRHFSNAAKPEADIAPYLVLGTLRQPISSNSYPQDENNFFYIRYTYKKEAINKKLPYHADSIVISRATVLAVDGQPIAANEATDMALYYMRGGSTSTRITAMQLVFADEAEVAEELRALVGGLKEGGKSSDDILAEASAYLTEQYGRPNTDNLRAFLKQHLGWPGK
jgi:hypothetical protein